MDDWHGRNVVYAGARAVNMSISGSHLIVSAIAIADDGHGIAHEIAGTSRRQIRVPDLLPGETAEVSVRHRSQNQPIEWAQRIALRGPVSEQRTTPECPAFGQCGGCSWQHLTYSAQLTHKRARVHRALQTHLSCPPEVPAPIPSPHTTSYRNKGKYVFGTNSHGVVMGAYRPRSHEIVSTLGCRVVEPVIDTVARELHQLVNKSSLPIYHEANHRSGLRYAVLRSNRSAETLVVLVASSDTDPQTLRALAEQLNTHPNVCGVLRCNNDLRSGGLLTDAIHVIAGDRYLREHIAGVDVSMDARAFWQVNRHQADAAYRDLSDSLGRTLHGSTSPATILELYSGVGGIAFHLASMGHSVIGIEREAAAVDAANQAAAGAGLRDRVSFRHHDATELTPDDFLSVDAVIVNPPRKGLGVRGLKQLCAAKPPIVAYLGCGVDSLASDLAVLVNAGYQIKDLQLYDFMPGTSQVETLAILSDPNARQPES